ncbi:MAG: hypothetical protein ACYC5V_03190 [Gemmatimonadaceae bacterium]
MDKRRMLLIGTLMVALGVALIAWAEAVDAQESTAATPASRTTAASGPMLTNWYSLVSREFATGVLADSGTSPPEAVIVSGTTLRRHAGLTATEWLYLADSTRRLSTTAFGDCRNAEAIGLRQAVFLVLPTSTRPATMRAAVIGSAPLCARQQRAYEMAMHRVLDSAAVSLAAFVPLTPIRSIALPAVRDGRADLPPVGVAKP